MNKFYLLTCALFLGATSTFAQTIDRSCVFVGMNEKEDGDLIIYEENGTVYENNATVTTTITRGDDFQGYMISSGLGIKNVSDKGKRFYIKYEIVTLPEGLHQICFNGTCLTRNNVGVNYYPERESTLTPPILKKNEDAKSLMAEWLPLSNYGTATVKYSIEYVTYNDDTQAYDITGQGPTITVNYQYQDPNAINGIEVDGNASTAYYDLSGRRVSTPHAGLYIQKTTQANGQVKSRKVQLK